MELREFDLYGFADGFKEGIHAQIGNLFQYQQPDDGKIIRLNKVKRDMTVTYSETSIRSRRQAVNGWLHQHEKLLFFSREKLEVGRHMKLIHRDHFEGTNYGDSLAFAHFPPMTSLWCETFEKKKLIYGNDNRVDVGGRIEGVSEGADGPKPRPRLLTDIEPLAYYQTPAAVLLTILKDYPLK